MQFASSTCLNLFVAVYVKERLSPSTKNIVVGFDLYTIVGEKITLA